MVDIKIQAQLVWLCLFISILAKVIYTLYLHPLASYPGPLVAKFTILWRVYQVWTGKRHLKLQQLHKKYGDFVRIGPNVLSICNASAQKGTLLKLTLQDLMKDIYGKQSTMIKSIGYDKLRHDERYSNIVFERDHRVHSQFKRELAPALSSKSLNDMEVYIKQNLDRFHQSVLKFGQNGGKAINMTKWMTYFTFDVLGDFCFGKPIGFLEAGDDHGWKDRTKAHSFFGAIVRPYIVVNASNTFLKGKVAPEYAWLRKYVVPKTVVEMTEAMNKDTIQKITNRLSSPNDRKDFFYYFLQNLDKEETQKELQQRLFATYQVVIIAGGETISTALNAAIYLLASNPRCYKKLRSEVESHFSSSHEMESHQLAQLSYLNAVINETLRIRPPLVGELPREVVEPSYVVGKKIPVGTEISVPYWALYHDARYFTAPEDFIPERWIDELFEKDKTKGREACQPFSLGSRVCLGKGMAYIEMRLALARWIIEFDFELADPNSTFDVEDYTITINPESLIVVRSRQ
ncbi:Isotrichodermin C-15 hydroxylase [Neolecta irregularis DAH-3]|uniref:Isotrichodermin C-15 hydroxylase n=1 Tax=Neolecta irregularis (strain DAH-3) TaxID=1198029 RepID=A0A1U7LNI3_NEOID|nr:Isotrichodermin C-15 hydroxylase [Neolecta irregularis DAH-3]|eukprot:OLL24230.1 Isotrichodermin C-15 hydroxylase [Neolecta irregularis DAH-3]